MCIFCQYCSKGFNPEEKIDFQISEGNKQALQDACPKCTQLVLSGAMPIEGYPNIGYYPKAPQVPFGTPLIETILINNI